MPETAKRASVARVREDLTGRTLGRVPAQIDEDAVRVTFDCTACSIAVELVARASSTWRVIGGGDAA